MRPTQLRNKVPCRSAGTEPATGAPAALFYFSFVTLSTLGYGDMSPRTDVGRTFASMEAVIGQLFLAILLARMVGLMALRSREEEESEA